MKKRYLCMAAIIFLMNTLTGCALKNENMEAIYKEFLDNGDVGSLQWSWVLEPGQYEDIRFVNDNMVAVQNGSDKWGVWDLEKEILVTSCKYNNIPNDAARYYSEGYAAVQKDGKWGFVDEAGQCVIPCQYDEVGDFSEGLAAVKDADTHRSRTMSISEQRAELTSSRATETGRKKKPVSFWHGALYSSAELWRAQWRILYLTTLPRPSSV